MVTDVNPPREVILDVGAQMIELRNLEMAIEWLRIMPDHNRTQAVISFTSNDELSVLD
jgi:hypothetical protein